MVTVMTRHRAWPALVLCGLVAAARAEPARVLSINGVPQRRLVVDTPVAPTPAAFGASNIIYLERCAGGCAVRYAPDNDARTNTSSIPKVQLAMIGEFVNGLQQKGALADAEWGQVVQCVREVYSPYGVVVTDVRPGGSYHMAIIAGQPTDIGLDPDVLGVAPLASDCRAIDNVISFTFANHHPPSDRVLNICWTAAQESAHAFGLDHEYAFSGNRSACTDPMTYRTDCGGEKFFRNEPASCGEYATRACKCGGVQNSHQKMLSVFGAGTPITGAPAVTMTSPVAGGSLGRTVAAQAGSKRGVVRVEAWFNGFSWAQVDGAAFGAAGQPNPAPYTLVVPTALPDGVIDVSTVAYDDLGAIASSATVTLTKGAPCTTAATCAAGQKCQAGKCLWDPPVGELGDSCTYAQFCKSLSCQGATGHQICSQDCAVGVVDACPAGFSCSATGGSGAGTCQAADGGGCCSAGSRGPASGLAAAGLAALVVVLVRRRRR
jgi:MYXO-CTERM domain-containing protein